MSLSYRRPQTPESAAPQAEEAGPTSQIGMPDNAVMVEALTEIGADEEVMSVLDLFALEDQDSEVEGVTAEKLDVSEKKIPEPSGVTFHPGRGTLFVVGDRGHIVEMTTEGEILNRERPKKADIEGITVGPEGTLFVTREGGPKIYEIDPDSLEVIRKIDVDRKHDGEKVVEKKRNDGLEGIVYVASHDAFFAVNQKRPACIVKLDMPESGDKDEAEIVDVIPLDGIVERQASDITFDPSTGNFLVTESQKKGGLLHVVSPDGDHVETRELPGKRTEGFAIADDGSAFVTQDNGPIWHVER